MMAEQPLADDDVRRIAIEVASALRAAHQRGLHHGGLQPKSILVQDDGSVLVTDFMLDRLLDPDVESQFSPPPAYVSPDAGNEPPTASDMYALGAILDEAMAGDTAHVAEMDGADRETTDTATAISAVISRLLAPRADARPSASEVLAALTESEPEPTTAPAMAAVSPRGIVTAHQPRSSDISLFEFVPEEESRRPLGVWLGVAAVAAVAILSLAAALLFFLDSDPDPEARVDSDLTPRSQQDTPSPPASTREAVAPAVVVPTATAAASLATTAPEQPAPQQPVVPAPTQQPEVAPPTQPAVPAAPAGDTQSSNELVVAAAEAVGRRGPANAGFYRTRDVREVTGLVTGRALQIYIDEAARLTAIDAYIDSVQTSITFEQIQAAGDSAVVVTVETWEHVDHRLSTGEVTGSRRVTSRITYGLVFTDFGWLIESIDHSILEIGPL